MLLLLALACLRAIRQQNPAAVPRLGKWPDAHSEGDRAPVARVRHGQRPVEHAAREAVELLHGCALPDAALRERPTLLGQAGPERRGNT